MARRLFLSAVTVTLFAALAAPLQASQTGGGDAALMTIAGGGAFVGADAPADLTVPMGDPPEPTGRVEAWLPQPPGTKKWITLEYGPYVVHPGSDLSRMDVEVPGANGYAVGFIPSVILPDGSEASPHDIHIHHAHWYWLDPDGPGYHRWFYGTGEERTQGSIMPAAKADPRYADGLRYGIEVTRGDRLGFLSMLHNKTAQALVVFLRVEIEFVYGTYDEIAQAKGWDFHNLTPTLIGSTFNVPRTGGIYTYPLDRPKSDESPYSNYANPVESAKVVPGVGQVWTSPWEGTIVIGAGHLHPGGKELGLSNLGRKDDPCPEDGDRFPGVTAARSRNITRNGVFPSEEYQMGLTQPEWRMYVRKGDRLVLNGVYDATDYAYPDAMSYFGFYIDRSEKTSAAEACRVELLGHPDATRDQIAWTVPNQEWPLHHPMPTCTSCDDPDDVAEPGPETNVVHIANHQYLPGNHGLEGPVLGPPVVARGDSLWFFNEDYSEGLVRHSVTSCKQPCNGPYVANYPFHDGVFDSGALGYAWEDAYVTARDEPYWELDTSDLEPGYYSYYCRLHAWMRGGFYVK